MILRIGLDIDDTVCDFLGPYLKRFGIPKEDCEITKNVTRVLMKDKDFWMNLPIIHRPNFSPELYCTKRVNSKAWSKKFLELNEIPVAPIYQIFYQNTNKSSRIKGKVDVFVDDSISNFIDLNLNGVPCLLMDGKHNQSWGPVGRVYSLDSEEIEESLHLFKRTVLNYFKDLVDEYRSM